MIQFFGKTTLLDIKVHKSVIIWQIDLLLHSTIKEVH